MPAERDLQTPLATSKYWPWGRTGLPPCVSGVGYSVAATTTAMVLTHAAPTTAVLAGVAITLVLTAVSRRAERSATHRASTYDIDRTTPGPRDRDQAAAR